MPSKMVLDREKSTRSVVAAGEANADEIGAQMAAVLSPHLKKDEKMPDCALLVRLLDRALDGATGHMVTSNEAHEAEQRDDDPPRLGRDEGAVTVNTFLGNTRDAATSIYGAATAMALGIPSELPRDPNMILRLGRTVHGAIPDVKLPKPLIPGATMDLGAIAAQLKAHCDVLDGHLRDVAREERELQITQRTKDESIENNDHWFAGVARILSGFLYAIRKYTLAERVKPSRRRPGTTASADDDPGDGGQGGGGTGGGGTPSGG